MNILFKLFLMIFCTISVSAADRVLYIYGDVAADGTIPSGDKKPFDQMRLNDTGYAGLSQFKEAVEQIGFAIEEKYDAEIVLNESLLKNYSVVLLASNQRRFSKDEAAAVKTWVENGGGLVTWSDSAFGGHYREVGVDNPTGRLSDNDITAQFGMYFLTDNGAGNYLVSQYEEDHYLNNYNRNGGIKYRGEGVSCVRVSKPARMLAKLQHGGLWGGLRVNKNDGVYNPETDAALAVAEIGKGRVIGTFDRNCFWNAGAGTRLAHADNREFVQRFVIWAAGKESSVIIPKNPRKISGKTNRKPIVSAGKDMVITSRQADLSGSVKDDGLSMEFPDVKWRMKKGPAKVTFENRNSHTANVRVFFPQPGKYVMQFVVDDGEFKVIDKITVTVK